MQKIRINNTNVKAIKPPATKTEGKTNYDLYRDDLLPGFGLRVTNSGAKAYFAEKRISGKNTRITIGKHGPLTPEQARKQAQVMRVFLPEIRFSAK